MCINKNSLKSHIENVHNPSGLEFKCEECKKVIITLFRVLIPTFIYFLFSDFSHFQAKQPLKSILKQFIQGKNHYSVPSVKGYKY